MKKSRMLLCASAMLLLASCGGGNQSSSSHATGLSSSEQSHATGLSSSEQSHATGLSSSEESHATGLSSSTSGAAWVPTEDVEVLIWCAEAAVDLTTAQVEEFIQDSGWADKVSFTVEPVGEGTAATQVITDLDAAGDIYFFAQDQLSRLVTAGGLTELTSRYTDPIKTENGAGSVQAATVGDKIYAFPATEDNGYYLYYNSEFFGANDVTDWEAMVSKAEAGSKKINFNYSSAWYNFGFFYGANTDSVWSTDDEGNFTEYADTYNTADGLKAAKGLSHVATSSAVVDSGSAGDIADNTVALVSGTWDYKAVVDEWGENTACVELPYFNVDGERIHTGSFSGNKLVGVKPQTNGQKARVTCDIAAYLTGEVGQLERFNELQWGPSNKAAAASEAVQNAPQIAALAKQNNYAKPQGQFPQGWWDLAGAIGSNINALGKEGVTDDALSSILETYAEGLDDLLTA